ncbi:hypothetical protein J5N97_021014 [Dioscorea zingiberensis]|uniref:Uncharacterized protein n=1 Tax=Dioscorea zingiberensis TaxID=325984 RepID=A0A9D5CHH2_9LILI|nr:hypothetical protein J5N97_021014 [Dioscorea zingiberensis]
MIKKALHTWSDLVRRLIPAATNKTHDLLDIFSVTELIPRAPLSPPPTSFASRFTAGGGSFSPSPSQSSAKSE